MKKNRTALVTYVFLGALLLGGIGFLSYSQISAAEDSKDAVDFSFPGLDGKALKLSDFRGKVVLVDVWATWCPPCRAEIPSFVTLYEKYKDEGLVIIGLATDDEGAKVVAPFAKEYKINYPLAIADMEAVMQIFGPIRGIPTTYLIDSAGNVVNKYVGLQTEEVFEKAFKALKQSS